MKFFPSLRRIAVVGCASVIVLAAGVPAEAQSGARPAPSSQPRPAGSGNNAATPGSAGRAADAPVGMRGYCPVCLVEMKQWVKGDPRFAVQFDGHQYLFPSAEQAEMFQQDPAKYVPVLGGDDVVYYARRGERVAGDLSHGVLHNGRHYFFATAQTKDMFRENPAAFEDADLALGGQCIVCQVNMNERVAGRPEFMVVHDGLRYQFPGEEQQEMFLQSPEGFVERVASSPAAGGSGARGGGGAGNGSGARTSTPTQRSPGGGASGSGGR